MATQVDPTASGWDGTGPGLVGDDAPAKSSGGPVRLGAYRLVHQLGEGGMGVVHLALDPHGRAVAIKVLRSHIAYDPDARTRLQREVDTLARIRDHRVAAVIDADIVGARPFLVTRYVAGPSLDEVVATDGPLRGDALLRLGRGLVGALDAIHAVGVVHRDLKPGNVLLEEGEPVVIDFGIAHVADDVRLTSVGLVMGTPGYLSPEVIEGATVTEATDWWGWAATVTFAASGRPPFGRGPMEAVLSRVRRGESDLTGVDVRLQPLLRAALSPDPWGRPPAGEVVAALERYALGGPATVAVPGPAGLPGTSALPLPGPVQPSATAPYPAGAAFAGGEPGTSDGEGSEDYWDAEPLGWDVPLPEEPRQPRPSRQSREWRTWRRGTSALPQGEGAPDPSYGAAAWPVPPSEPAAASFVPSSFGPTPYRPPAPVHHSDDSHQTYTPPLQTPSEGPRQDPRIGRPLRSGTLAALVLLLACATASWPFVVVIVAVGWCWVARFCDRSVTALVVRRFERGERRTDLPRAVASSPWHVASAAAGTVSGLVLPAVVAVSTTVCATLGVTAVASVSARVAVPPALAVGFLAGVFVAWWGPGGASLRRGSRSLVRGLAPTGAVGDVLVGLLLAAALGLVVMAFLRAGHVVWWPLHDNPLRALDSAGT